MVKLLIGIDSEVEVDVDEMTIIIDDVFHHHITQVNGCTVSHDTINTFIRVIINEMNNDLQSRRALWERVVEEGRYEKELIDKQIARGRYVRSLDSRWNRFKYKYLGYVLWAEDIMKLYRPTSI